MKTEKAMAKYVVAIENMNVEPLGNQVYPVRREDDVEQRVLNHHPAERCRRSGCSVLGGTLEPLRIS
jgi:hypothetical protein